MAIKSKSYQISWWLPSMNQLFQYTYRVPGLVIQTALTTFFCLWCGPLLSQSDCPFRTGLWYGNRGIFDSGNVRNTSLPKTSFPPRTRDGPAQATCALDGRMASMVGWSKPVTKWCNQISSLGGLILYQSSRIISIISALRKNKKTLHHPIPSGKPKFRRFY